MLTIPEIRAARESFWFKPLACPHCGEVLNRHAPLVVTTRNCPSCGRRVVAEPDDEAPPPFTREQLDAAKEAQDRATSRACWAILSGFLVWLLVTVVFALYRDTIRDAVRPVVDPGWFFMLVFALPILAGLVPALVITRRANRTALRCPHCAAGMHRFGRLVRLTGNCWRCARRLADPPPDEPTGPLPAVEVFKASAARLSRADNIGGFLLLGVMLALGAACFGLGSVVNPERFWPDFEQRYGVLTAALLRSGVVVVWVGAWFGALAGGIWAVHRRLRKLREADPVLNCPHCRAGLLPVPHTVATRRCPECRRRVLAEPEPSPIPTEPTPAV